MYSYTPLDKLELPQLCLDMRMKWEKLGIKGRVYIAEEGINGQLVVPELVVSAFERSFPHLLHHTKLFHGQSIETNRSKSTEPFHKLDIRIRHRILNDGFQRGQLNLQHSGHSLQPEQWHNKLKTRNDMQDSEMLVLDVRNFYEHEIGRFVGATRIMVDTFRDTFDALDEILEKYEVEHDGHKPKEVMMYCTGGIRCEKVGAYLTQYKGILNVQKLHGGIVNYIQFLRKQRQKANGFNFTSTDDDAKVDVSLFKGKNFVFDQRCVGDFTESEKVTDDVLGRCYLCGEPCDRHTNCSNVMCHGLILQCSKCALGMLGACNNACKQEFLKMESMSQEEKRLYRKKNASKWKPSNPNSIKFIKFRPVFPTKLVKTEI
ncbi:hypothetical protein PsorP6_004654 [Peronosclerospora sorghi]|uniref:Uncharacterized protein n=1 Tax=Peronosclerospora sorghi TaxID=230839 RepID=A0ACC0VJI5_9STRA|nr:hypothetical protein PsorP6_004654 [Peronosclerospora sorghi]